MRAGDIIREYRLIEKIDRGGMGDVWRAEHTLLGTPVAIKVVSSHLYDDPQFTERFVEEAKAQASLKHPGVLGVREFFVEDDVHHLVMPLVEGETLEHRIERRGGPLGLEESLDIAEEILDALVHVHRHDIIHRDIKTANVLIDSDGHPHLMDFGIALRIGRRVLTQAGTSLGSPHSMSPEQIQNPRSVDHRTDIYGFGCVVYEMLTGRPPFLVDHGDGDTDYRMKEAHLKRRVVPVHEVQPALPSALHELVGRALAKTPADRWGSAAEMLEALREFRRTGTTPPPRVAPESTVFERPPTPRPEDVQSPPPLAPPPGPSFSGPSSSGPSSSGPTPPPQGPGGGPARGGPGTGPSTPQGIASPPPSKPGGGKGWWIAGCIGCGVLGVLAATIVGVLLYINIINIPRQHPPEQDGLVWRGGITDEADTTGRSLDELPETYGDDMGMRIEAARRTLATENHEIVLGPYLGFLDENAKQILHFELQRGVSYKVFGVCDDDCSDLDLRLYDENGREIDVDELEDPFPIVSVSPQWTGPFELEAVMYSCEQEPCYFAVLVAAEDGSTL